MVFCGIDVLERENFARLNGRKVGLITNHTGRNLEGPSTTELLMDSDECELTALCGPEHGIRGLYDEAVQDSLDAETGLPVYSLYGARTRPTPEQLNGIDLLIYDIQDIGTRFYTYISALGHCLEAAADAGVSFLVLDRPNPIGGLQTEGPIADADSLDYTAYHQIPIRHGLSVGEMARLIVREKRLDLDLKVIDAEGWVRKDWWDRTGLTWINPSPNMRSLTQASLYPGVGLLEFTNVSVGRGTDTPFEVIGAPWALGRELAFKLNRSRLPGVRFVSIFFTPRASKHEGVECEGVNLIVTNREEFQPVLTGLKIAESLLYLTEERWESEKISRLLVHNASLEMLMEGEKAEVIVEAYQNELRQFEQRTEPIKLYS